MSVHLVRRSFKRKSLLQDKTYRLIALMNVCSLASGSAELQNFKAPLNTFTEVEFWHLVNPYLLNVFSLPTLKTQNK